MLDTDTTETKQSQETAQPEYTATYSPEDNKLRLYAGGRLPRDIYERVRGAGFVWAPQQKLFVAPMWTPEREELLIDLCGEIGDEDTSLVDRAEGRAERFEEYSEKRLADAEQAKDAVSQIADNIPLGQPILVGHHSERRARKDAERIQNGMKKAVQLWETSKYWTERAKGALRHAKYKEKPEVRARRIKGLEADKRKHERDKAHAEKCLDLWAKLNDPETLKKKSGEPSTPYEKAVCITNYIDNHGHYCFPLDKYPRTEHTYEGEKSLWGALTDGIITADQARELAVPVNWNIVMNSTRWINHINNRLLYEKAMLDEAGASELIAPKKRPTQLPLVNYRQAEFRVPKMHHRGEFETIPQVEMTSEQYKKIYSDYKATRIIDNSHRIRVAMVRLKDYPQFVTDKDKEHANQYGYNCMRTFQTVAVFLTDSKAHAKPAPIQPEDTPAARALPLLATARPYTPSERTEFDDLRDSLKAGVQVVSAPQLFPTPPELAARMVDEAQIEQGHDVLEPSAGTGNIIKALPCVRPNGTVTAVEISRDLTQHLESLADLTFCKDFLTCNGDLGKFDRILMNPPFADGQDIEHVKHAYQFLKDGGRIVAIMGEGAFFRSDRKATEFRAWLDGVGYSEQLPADTFKASGTGVNTRLVVIDKR